MYRHVQAFPATPGTSAHVKLFPGFSRHVTLPGVPDDDQTITIILTITTILKISMSTLERSRYHPSTSALLEQQRIAQSVKVKFIRTMAVISRNYSLLKLSTNARVGWVAVWKNYWGRRRVKSWRTLTSNLVSSSTCLCGSGSEEVHVWSWRLGSQGNLQGLLLTPSLGLHHGPRVSSHPWRGQ